MLIPISKDNYVTKSEALLKARYQLGELALKLISIVYSNVKRSDETGKDYEIKVIDIANLMNKNYGEMYNLLKDATDELLSNPVKIEDKEKKEWIAFNWISDAQYKDGVISFTISKRLKPFILDLKQKFLKYRLENILNLRGTYVIRLYELLKDKFNEQKRYNRKTEFDLSLKELREILEIPKSYQYSSHIKTRILDKAKEQFAKHTDIIFDYEEIKMGRKIIHIKFIVSPNSAKVKEKKSKQVKNNNFKSFRQKLIQNAQDKIIVYNDIIFKVKDNLLMRDDTILSKEEAFDWWKTFYNNQDKLKVLDKNEFEKLQQEKIKEVKDIYKKIKELKEKYKYLIVNFAGEEKEATLADIQLEDKKYKLFLNIDNTTAIKEFDNLNQLRFFLKKCNEIYKKRENLKK